MKIASRRLIALALVAMGATFLAAPPMEASAQNVVTFNGTKPAKASSKKRAEPQVISIGGSSGRVKRYLSSRYSNRNNPVWVEPVFSGGRVTSTIGKTVRSKADWYPSRYSSNRNRSTYQTSRWQRDRSNYLGNSYSNATRYMNKRGRGLPRFYGVP